MAYRYTGFADEAGKPLETQIETVSTCGWKSIELRQIGDGHVCDLSDDAWAATLERLNEASIVVSGFGGQVANWGRPITTDFQVDLDEVRRVAPRMHAAGTKLLRIMSYPNAKDDPWPTARWRAEVVRRLRELARIAEGEGILLGHENCNGYGSIGPSQMLDLMEAVDCPALTLIFDTGNNTLHDNDPEATWRYWEAVREHVTHIHVKAARLNADGKMATCYPDEDPLQRRILADARDRGYDGWLSIEPHLAAAIHAGREADASSDAPRRIWLEYARRLEALVAGL